MTDAVRSDEVADGLPVLAGSTALERSQAAVPARQAAALTATGFVAGVATAAVVTRRRARPGGRGLLRRRKAAGLGEILSSNSFLIDVHLLKRH